MGGWEVRKRHSQTFISDQNMHFFLKIANFHVQTNKKTQKMSKFRKKNPSFLMKPQENSQFIGGKRSNLAVF